jgi:hypothetical protein
MYDLIGAIIGLFLIGGLLAPMALAIYIFFKL